MADPAPSSPPPAPPPAADLPATPPASPPAITPPPAAEAERDNPMAKAKAKVAEAKAEAIAAVYMIPVFFLGLIPKAGEMIVAVIVFGAQAVVFVVKVAVALIPQWTLGTLIFAFTLTYLTSGIQAFDEGSAVKLYKTGNPMFAGWDSYEQTYRLTISHMYALAAFLFTSLSLELLLFASRRKEPPDVLTMVGITSGLLIVAADVVLFAAGCNALGVTWFKAVVFTAGYLSMMVLTAVFSNLLIALIFHRRNEP